MPTRHDHTKLKKRQDGSGPIYTGWVKPGDPIPEGKIEAGNTLTLRSAAGIPIIARVQAIKDGQILCEIIGFEEWSDEYHDGMTHGDIIVCDERFVIGSGHGR